MNLSDRLETAVSMIRPCVLLADVGCDHAYVSIEAVRRGIAKRAVASDAVAGPLRRASRNIRLAGLEGSIDILLSDGLKAYGDDIRPGCVVITGMGGRLIAGILREGRKNGFGLGFVDQFVLGPQSEPEVLRHYLIDEAGLSIVNEYCIQDDGKYYMLLDVRQRDAAASDRKSSTMSETAYPDNNAAAKSHDFKQRYPSDIINGGRTAAGSLDIRISGGDTADGFGEAYTEADYLYGRRIDASAVPIYREWLDKLRKQKLAALDGIASIPADESSEYARAGIKRLADEIRLIDEKISALDLKYKGAQLWPTYFQRL